MNKPASIYGLTDPETGLVRYVGCTTRPVIDRVIQRIGESGWRNTYCDAWVQKLLKRGLEPGWVVFEVVEDGSYEIVSAREKHWVGQFPWEQLLNMTIGGRGSLGYKHSEASRIKIRIARAKQDIDMDWVRSLSKDRTAQTAVLMAFSQTEGRKEQVSKQFKGVPKSEEHRRKIGEAMMGNRNRAGKHRELSTSTTY